MDELLNLNVRDNKCASNGVIGRYCMYHLVEILQQLMVEVHRVGTGSGGWSDGIRIG